MPGLIRIVGRHIAARDGAELAAQFRLPNVGGTNQAFLVSVKALMEVAEQQKESLVAAGMVPVLLEQLGSMVSEFEAASEVARARRLSHIGARADLAEIAWELMQEVRVLDGINRWRFGGDFRVMAEWNAACHLPTVSVSDQPAPGGKEVTPPDSGGVAPAA